MATRARPYFGGLAAPLSVEVRADIRPILGSADANVDLGEVLAAGGAQKLRLTNHSNQPQLIDGVWCDLGFITASLSGPARVAPGAETEITIACAAAPVGTFEGRLSVSARDAPYWLGEWRVTGSVASPLPVDRDRLNLGFLEVGEAYETAIEVGGLADTGALVAWTDVPDATVAVEPLPAATGVRLVLRGRGVGAGLLRGSLWLQTSLPHAPLVRFSVLGQIPVANACCGG